VLKRGLAALLLAILLWAPLHAAVAAAGPAARVAPMAAVVSPHVGHGTVRLLGTAQPPIVPTPGSCAPQQSGQNPILQYLNNLVDGIPIIGGVTQLVGLVGSVLGTIVEWVTNPNQGAQSVGDWALWNVFGYNPQDPSCYSPTSPYGFFSSVFLGDVQLSADSIYSDAYNALAWASIVLVLVAGALRLVRGMSDPEVRGEHLILDTTLRVVMGIGAIYIAFPVLSWLLPLVTGVGLWIFDALLGVAGAPIVRDPLGVLLYTSAVPILRLGLVALLILPFAIWFLMRVVGLLIIRFLVVCFGVMFLPLLIAVAVYDPKSRAVRWWLEALASAAIIPLVTACLFGGTLGLALRFGEGSPSDGIFSMAVVAEVVVALGGLWLSGRVLKAILFHDVAGGGHPFDPLRNFVARAVGMAAVVPAAAAGLLTGPMGAAVAYSAGGVGGLGVLAASQRMRGRQGGQGQGGSGSGGAGVPGSAAEVLTGFFGSASGAGVAEAATPDLPPDTMLAGRWAALSADPNLRGPMERLRTAVLAHASRTGQMGVAPEEADRFVRAARAQRMAYPPGREAA
jgi:hypothetical protein